MPKDKKLDLPGEMFIRLKQGVKASEKQQDILEDIASQPLFKKKSKGGLNKFMKDRSGAAVTQKETDRIKNELIKKESGAAVTQEELDRKKSKIEPKRMPYFEPEGMEENYKAERMPYFEPEGMEEKYKPKPMPYFEVEGMEEGGEVVFGKGKDYIKDLL